MEEDGVGWAREVMSSSSGRSSALILRRRLAYLFLLLRPSRRRLRAMQADVVNLELQQAAERRIVT